MNIKQYRTRAGMTQQDLADAVGVSRNAVTMWETADVSPRAELLPKIAQLLGCTIDDLYRDEPGKEAG